MRIEGLISKHAEAEYDTDDIREAYRMFCEDFPDVQVVETINDVLVIGFCEGCLIPLLEGDKYFLDDSGIYVCEKCNESAIDDSADKWDA